MMNPKSESKSRDWLKRFIRKNLGLVMTIILLLWMIFASDSLRTVFFRPGNLLSVLRQLSIYMLVSCGLTFVVISGGIDISVGSILSFSGMAAAAVGLRALPVEIGLILGAFAGLAVGLLNGMIISLAAIPPFIVTLATFSIFRGAAYLISNGATIRVGAENWNRLGTGTFCGLPLSFLLALIVYVPAWLLLNKSKFGKDIYSIGENPQAADFSGIPVARIRRIAYLLSGLTAGIAGAVSASRLNSGVPSAGYDYEIDALAAIIIGGASMRGGVGRLGGTVLGCVIITVLSNAMNILGINSYWRFVIKGVIILVGVSIEYYRYRKETGHKS